MFWVTKNLAVNHLPLERDLAEQTWTSKPQFRRKGKDLVTWFLDFLGSREKPKNLNLKLSNDLQSAERNAILGQCRQRNSLSGRSDCGDGAERCQSREKQRRGYLSLSSYFLWLRATFPWQAAIIVKNLETLVCVSPPQCWLGYYSRLTAPKSGFALCSAFQIPWLSMTFSITFTNLPHNSLPERGTYFFTECKSWDH